MKKIILILMVLVVTYTVCGQAQPHSMLSGFKEKKEAALKDLEKKTNPDTARVNALINLLGTALVRPHYAELLDYYTEARQLSEKLNYTYGRVYCFGWKGQYHRESGEPGLATLYYDSAISADIRNKEKTDRMLRALAEIQRRKGLLLFSADNFHGALTLFFEALKYYEKNPSIKTSMVYQNISNAYAKLHNTEQSLFYARKNAAFCESLNLPGAIQAQAFLAVVEIYIARNEIAAAAQWLEKSSPFIPDPEEIYINTGYYIMRGDVMMRMQLYDSAMASLQEALKFARTIKHSMNVTSALDLLYQCAMKMGRKNEAKKYVEEEMIEAEHTKKINSKIQALLNMADYLHNTGNDSRAYQHLMAAHVLRDSFITENNMEQINRLATVYETEKKEKEILKLQSKTELQSVTLTQQSKLNKAYIFAIIGMLLLSFFAFRYYQNRQQISKQQQEIQQQKITQLEKDKQLLNIDAMLKGQEEERNRIAKDLHDGLGGLLSGVKLSFMSLKEKLPVTPEGESGFEHSTRMIDRTITELRKVAHNLTPEILMKFGLEEALREFCGSIEASSDVKVVFQLLGKQRKLGSHAESAVYRIVQELVNNALKHAKAASILVQLTYHDEKITLAVEDDGKGFDTTELLSKNGAGISNIQHRVNYFKGMIDIDSMPGKGTSITIELYA